MDSNTSAGCWNISQVRNSWDSMSSFIWALSAHGWETFIRYPQMLQRMVPVTHLLVSRVSLNSVRNKSPKMVPKGSITIALYNKVRSLQKKRETFLVQMPGEKKWKISAVSAVITLYSWDLWSTAEWELLHKLLKYNPLCYLQMYKQNPKLKTWKSWEMSWALHICLHLFVGQLLNFCYIMFF